MSKYLVTYATLAGSTVDVAKAVADELTAAGAQVDIRPLADVGTVDQYEGVAVGAPMIVGWHRSALSFLSRNRNSWSHSPVGRVRHCDEFDADHGERDSRHTAVHRRETAEDAGAAGCVEPPREVCTCRELCRGRS